MKILFISTLPSRKTSEDEAARRLLRSIKQTRKEHEFSFHLDKLFNVADKDAEKLIKVPKD